MLCFTIFITLCSSHFPLSPAVLLYLSCSSALLISPHFPHSPSPPSFSCTESVFYLTSIVTYFLPLFHCTFWPWSGWATLIRLKSRQEAAAYSCQINDSAFGTFPPVSLLLNSPFYFRISLIFPFSVIINCFLLIMFLSYFLLLLLLFTQWRGWLRHCATSQNVADSIPDGVTGIFRWHNPSGRTMTPGVDSVFNREEYQKYFLGGKESRCVRLTYLPITYADCLEIWEPQPPRTFGSSPGLYRNCFTFHYCLLPLPASFLFCSTGRPGTAVAQWLRCSATNRKVAVSIPASVSGFFIDIKSFRSHYGPEVDSAS